MKNPLELAAYATEHDALTQLLPADQRFSTVMLDAPLATLAARVSKRDRASEVETAAAATADDEVAVAPPYLAALAAAHDEYYAAVAHPKRRVAADGAPAEVAAAVLAAIADLVDECGGGVDVAGLPGSATAAKGDDATSSPTSVFDTLTTSRRRRRARADRELRARANRQASFA